MRTRMYGGVRGRKTKVGGKPTFVFLLLDYKVWAGAVQTLLCRSIRDSPGMCCSMRLTALTSLREARGLQDLLSDRQADMNA